jgi:hypothetical protein
MIPSETKTPTKNSVCLLVCYFGVLPPYLDCVLRSCAFNPDINWLIFTDDVRPRELPTNVEIRRATLKDLREQFSRKLGFQVALEHPRQLCNMKPAFGYFFEELLRDYEFWGHCDLDMIFGNVRKFLTSEILAAYDRILNLGHLCLYRNSEKVNRYFMLKTPNAPFYKDVFEQGVEIAFDEEPGIEKIFSHHNIPQYKANIIVDIVRPTRWRYPRFDGIGITNYHSQVFYWYEGELFQYYLKSNGTPAEVEYAYIHFQKRTMPAPAFDLNEHRGFLITPDGFFRYSKEKLGSEDFSKYNQGHFRPIRELVHLGSKSLRRRLGMT